MRVLLLRLGEIKNLIDRFQSKLNAARSHNERLLITVLIGS